MRIKLLEQKMQTSPENAHEYATHKKVVLTFPYVKKSREELFIIIHINLLLCRMVGSESAEKRTGRCSK